MLRRRLVLVSLVLTGFASAAGDSSGVSSGADRVEHSVAKLAPPLAMQFRMLAAQALQPRYPAMAHKFVETTLAEIRTRKGIPVAPDVVRALAETAPAEAVAILPEASPGSTGNLILALSQHHLDSAVALYRQTMSHGKVALSSAAPLLVQLSKDKPADAARLFQDTVASVSFEPLEPMDAWILINSLTAASARFDANAGADVAERILTIVATPGYGEKSKTSLAATYQTASGSVDTVNSRDTLLLAGGARLQALAPERMAKFHDALSRWDFSKQVVLKAFRNGTPSTAVATASASATIRQGLSQFRGLPTDQDRGRLALDLAARIRELPAGAQQLGLARSLCSLSTEGDLGLEALAAVGGALGYAIRGADADAENYMELASLVRYERIPPPSSLPGMDAAEALLALRERLVQENGFTLTAMDGKRYTLGELRGRVVLLNFWATWCPPCRREMPDMETLYRRFQQKGLTVLAVSDEDRETVAGFLEKQKYTFPVLLDPGRVVHTAFNVEGIPKSFLFDREGKLVSLSIDMRTERQFLEMLKKAGLE